MKELNIQLLEKFKQCDRFLRDAYNTSTGVTEYINLMESESVNGQNKVSGWNEDYKELKRVRWIRNQLAHDASIDDDICNDSDYAWLCDFYDRLMKADDPLARLYHCQNQQNSVHKQTASKGKENPDIRQFENNNYQNLSQSEKKTDKSAGWFLIVFALVILCLVFVMFNNIA